MSDSEVIKSNNEHNDSLFESNFSQEESASTTKISNQPVSAETTDGISALSTKDNNAFASTSTDQPTLDSSRSADSTAGDSTFSAGTATQPASEGDIHSQLSLGPQLTLRSLVTTKEAGIVIGKAGATVNELRDRARVKAGVSKQANGVPERVLTIVGSVEGVAQAYGMVARALIESPPIGINYHNNALLPPPVPDSGLVTLRLLVYHQQMGVIIGKQGVKIKSIQENFNIKMVASKDMLPQSTERVVEIQGTADNLQNALYEIGNCLMEDVDNLAGTIAYVPHASHYIYMANSRYNANGNNQSNSQNSSNSPMYNNIGSNSRYNNNSHGTISRPAYNSHNGNGSSNNSRYNNQNNNQDPSLIPTDDEVSDKFSISVDMVGCLIGKGGAKIQHIRRVSGAKISISKQPDEETGERTFTITGTPEANDRAMKMVHDQLESEKQRRTSTAVKDNSLTD